MISLLRIIGYEILSVSISLIFVILVRGSYQLLSVALYSDISDSSVFINGFKLLMIIVQIHSLSIDLFPYALNRFICFVELSRMFYHHLPC